MITRFVFPVPDPLRVLVLSPTNHYPQTSALGPRVAELNVLTHVCHRVQQTLSSPYLGETDMES